MKGGEGGLSSARLIMGQVQYPSDYVGADGKWYPTVGEAFRKGSGLAVFSKILEAINTSFSEILVDKVTIKCDESNLVTYTSELGNTYDINNVSIISETYSVLDRILIKASDVNLSTNNFYSNKGVYFNTNLSYLNGAAINKGEYEIYLILGVVK